ncbi:MAG TPA: hypothetical protein VFL08_15820 [Arthrobacter sp.]|nr:hypothetical protein [Arthrobacter sp.]
MGEQDQLRRFVQAGKVCVEPVADSLELQAGEKCGAVFIAREGSGIGHVCPEVPALPERRISWLGCDGFHGVFDGGRFGWFLTGGRERDAVGGFEEAAAAEEFGVDRAGLGGAGGQGEAGAGFAVVGENVSSPTIVTPCAASTPVSAAMVPA